MALENHVPTRREVKQILNEARKVAKTDLKVEEEKVTKGRLPPDIAAAKHVKDLKAKIDSNTHDKLKTEYPNLNQEVIDKIVSDLNSYSAPKARITRQV